MSLPEETRFFPGQYYKSNKGKAYRLNSFYPPHPPESIAANVAHGQSMTISGAGRKCYWNMVNGKEMKRKFNSTGARTFFYSYIERGYVGNGVEILGEAAHPNDVWREDQKKIVRLEYPH